MTEAEEAKAVTLAAKALMEPILKLMEEDSHQFGTRPCSTCHSISILVGRPFGCNRLALLRSK